MHFPETPTWISFFILLINWWIILEGNGAYAWRRRPFLRRQDDFIDTGEDGDSDTVTDNIAIESNSDVDIVEATMVEVEGNENDTSATNIFAKLRGLGGGGSGAGGGKGRGRGVLGFLPGLNFGGGGSGKGLFGGGGKGMGGLFGGGSTDKEKEKENETFPEYPITGGYGPPSSTSMSSEGETQTDGQNGWSSSGGSSSSGSSSDSDQKGKGFLGGLFRNPFGGGGGGGGVRSLFRNPFRGGGGSGGGSSGKGRSRFRLLSRLNEDKPCAAGLSTLPILSRLPFLPKGRFPSFVPSGTNTCDATCGTGEGEWKNMAPDKEEQMGWSSGNEGSSSSSGGYDSSGSSMSSDNSSCTYNWRDSLTRFPFLLFRCSCKSKCPEKKVKIGGPFNAQCEDVSNEKSRCKCPYGEKSYKCIISVLPVAVPLLNRKKPYYCTCCKETTSNVAYGVPVGTTASATEEVGGYDGGGGYRSMSSSSSTSSGGYSSRPSSGGRTNEETASSDNVEETAEKAVPTGRPLGIEHLYSHL